MRGPFQILYCVSARGESTRQALRSAFSFAALAIVVTAGIANATTLVAIDVPGSNGALMSGTYTMSGWALSDTSVINPNSLQVTIGTAAGMGSYGVFPGSYPRPDVCGAYPAWPPCNAQNNNVGWQYSVNTATLTQGANQTVTVTAANTDPSPTVGSNQRTQIVVDQPPNPTLSAVPLSGGGSGTFSFTVTTSTGMANQLWINGQIATALGAATTCSFSYWVTSGSFALVSATGQWQWGTLSSGLSNSACRINADSSYSGGGLTGTLNLDITFLGGLPGGQQQQIWMNTSDQWLQSNWTFARYWDTQVYAPVISSFSPASGIAGTMVTINGSNFQPSPTVTIGGMSAGMMESTATTITAMVPNAPTGMQNVVVNVIGMTATATQQFQIMPAAASISSVSPPGAPVGAAVTINGSGFGTSGTVVFAGFGIPLMSPSWTDTSITFTVPAVLSPAGQVPLVVIASSGTASRQYNLTPGITTLTRSSGPPNMGITITGTNFGAAQVAGSAVYLNGTLMPVNQTPTNPPMPMWSDTSITVQVPSGQTGTITVLVNNQTSPTKAFTVTGGLITCSN